jgi:hypothetical protein
MSELCTDSHRMGWRPSEDGSHVIMVSQPETVAGVILTAAAAVDRTPAAAGG